VDAELAGDTKVGIPVAETGGREAAQTAYRMPPFFMAFLPYPVD
jgi:hypothetical protein